MLYFLTMDASHHTATCAIMAWCVPTRTVRYLTTYEFVKVIGIRATQLQYGAPSAIRYQEYGLDPEDVLGRAQHELALRKLNLVLRRPLTCTHNCPDSNAEFVSLNALSFEVVPSIDDEYIEPLNAPDDGMEDGAPQSDPTYVFSDAMCDGDAPTRLLKKTLWIYPPEQGADRFLRFVTTTIRAMASKVVSLPDPTRDGDAHAYAIVVQPLSFTQRGASHKLETDGALVVTFEVAATLHFVQPFHVAPTLALCTIRRILAHTEADTHGLAPALRTAATRADALALATLDMHEACTAAVHVIILFSLEKYKTRMDGASNDMYVQRTGATHSARIEKNTKIRVRLESVFTYKDTDRAWDTSLVLAAFGSFVERLDT